MSRQPNLYGKLASLFVIGLMFLSIIVGVLGLRRPQQIYDSARSRPQPRQLNEAEKLQGAETVLIKYFSELHDGNYEAAVAHYEGDDTLLKVMNPSEKNPDMVTLFEDACAIDGFLCLDILEVTSAQKVAPHQYRFEVVFQNEDGSIYKHQNSNGFLITEFSFTVIEHDGDYFVQQLPIHG